MYNDEFPQHLSKSDIWYGHMKGLFAFLENSRGFWLIHSVPKLSMESNMFVYPNSSKEYAQHFLCVTLNYSCLETIADHLAISRPLILSFRLPESIEKSIPKLKKIFNHEAERNASLFLSSFLNATKDDVFLRVFSKSRKFNQDLYSDLVAPALKAPLYVETWRHSASNLPSNCTTEYWVKNIEKLEWPKSMNVKFKSTQDHSKWTTSTNEEGEKWTCFGDINRSVSQFARGGGTLCVKDPRLWKLFRDLVVQVEGCPITIPWSKLYSSLPLN
nr:deoxyribonuclease ii [Hymenolepis microstoma]